MLQTQKKSRPNKRAAIKTIYTHPTSGFKRRQVRRCLIGFFTLLLLGFGCGKLASTQAAPFNSAPLALPIAGLLVVLGWVANNGVRELRRWWLLWTREEARYANHV